MFTSLRLKKSNIIIVIALLALAVLACTCGNLNDLTNTGGGGDSSPDVPTYDGGDGYTTGFVREIQFPGSQSATIDDIFVAHNYVFQGSSGRRHPHQTN